MLFVGIFVKYILSLCIETKIFFCKPEQREDNSYNLPIGQSRFSFELTFMFILIENGVKQKVKMP